MLKTLVRLPSSFPLLRFLFLVLLLPVLGVSAPASAASLPSKRLFGTDYIDARVVGSHFGLTASWVVPRTKLRLQSRWTTIDFTLHKTEFSLNKLALHLSEPVAPGDNTVFIAKHDVEKLLTPILRPGANKAVPNLKTILIDAGHGGSDPGNQNRSLKLQEKAMTLDVAKRLERLLKARGYRVAHTRTRDRFISLDERAALIRKHKADLFISIHFNGFSNPSVAGTETYVMTPRFSRSTPQAERDARMASTNYPANRHDHWNALLGYHMHRRLVDTLDLPDRGLKRFRYSVLRDATCPAVLVEAAFLSNAREGRLVATPAFRQKIADAIAAGVDGYADALKRARS